MKTFYLDTNEPVTQKELDELGVLYWNVPADTYDKDGILDKICTEQGYNYREVVRFPSCLPSDLLFHFSRSHRLLLLLARNQPRNFAKL